MILPPPQTRVLRFPAGSFSCPYACFVIPSFLLLHIVLLYIYIIPLSSMHFLHPVPVLMNFCQTYMIPALCALLSRVLFLCLLSLFVYHLPLGNYIAKHAAEIHTPFLLVVSVLNLCRMRGRLFLTLGPRFWLTNTQGIWSCLPSFCVRVMVIGSCCLTLLLPFCQATFGRLPKLQTLLWAQLQLTLLAEVSLFAHEDADIRNLNPQFQYQFTRSHLLNMLNFLNSYKSHGSCSADYNESTD